MKSRRLGCKDGRARAEVYALVSDGSYLMLHSELLTSIQEGMKINVIMLDNGGFQCIHDLQTSHGSPTGFGNELRYRPRYWQALGIIYRLILLLWPRL